MKTINKSEITIHIVLLNENIREDQRNKGYADADIHNLIRELPSLLELVILRVKKNMSVFTL